MTLEDLEKEIPELYGYTKTMPPEIRQKARIKVHPPGGLIHQKDCELQYLGIVAKGENRVINEFENGKIYMIETNQAIDFIGEVTLLANLPRTSVTIEALTANTVVYIPRKDAEKWVDSDPHILRKMAQRTAFKLYRSSYNNGLKLYYPPAFLIADHLVRLYEQEFPAVASDLSPRGIPQCLSLWDKRTSSGKAWEEGFHTYSAGNTGGKFTFTLQKTRECLGEELGMNIKTLDRAVRSMQKDGFFSLVKGKITFGPNEYLSLKEYISTEKG